MGNYIGILLDGSKFKRIPQRKYGHERLNYYNKAAQTYGLVPFYLTIHKINVKEGKAQGFIYINEEYHYIQRAIPKIIHNRSLSTAGSIRNKVKQLSKVSYLYNEQTRYSKNYIHQILAKSSLIRPYLPYTLPLTKKNFTLMIQHFPSLYIKPSNGSLGLGIIRIDKRNNNWLIRFSNSAKILSTNQLVSILKRLTKNRQYIIQQTVALAKINGGAFDIRVTVQRNSIGAWQVTGMVAKAAKRGKHVSNVARGGKVYRLEPSLKKLNLNVTNTKQSIERLAIFIAQHLSQYLPHLADIGLDIGIDKNGKPYFIEFNGRDLRYSFQLGKLYKEWYNTFKTPIAYGRYLMEK